MINKYSKKILFLLFGIIIAIVGCKKQEPVVTSGVAPDTELITSEPQFDFVEMHNSVIDNMSAMATPFFFINNGEFDISGDNEKKLIEVTCKCMNGTTKQDVDLFFSLALNLIAFNASEQDFRFNRPSVDDEGTYIDYGNVFDTYNLKLHAETSSGEVIRDVYYKAGSKIDIDSRFWRE